MASKRSYPCDICQYPCYTSVQRRKHKAKQHFCYKCQQFVLTKSNHFCNPAQSGFGHVGTTSPFVLSQAGVNTFKVFTAKVKERVFSIEKLITKYSSHITELLEDLIKSEKSIKARLVINVVLKQQKTGEEKEHSFGHYYSVLLNSKDIKKFLFEHTSRIIKRLNFYNTGGSSWSVLSLPTIDIHTAKYSPLDIGMKVPTPSCYKNKCGLINIPTTQNLCFAYCAIACYMKIRCSRMGERSINKYREFMRVNYDEESHKFHIINFSELPQSGVVTVHDIDIFEKNNHQFTVNLFGHCEKDKAIYPIRLTKFEERQFHMDLLLLVDGENDRSHFVLIYDFDLFMKKRNCTKKYYCKRCLQAFRSNEERLHHRQVCSEIPPQRIVFPQFKSVNYKIGCNEIQHTYWVSADFETYMEVRLTVVIINVEEQFVKRSL